jgi:hypothetical protein
MNIIKTASSQLFFKLIVVSIIVIGSAEAVSAQQSDEQIQNSTIGSKSTIKGNVLISTTFSLSHTESENESRLIQNLDESYRLDWNITLRSGYFIKDNFALGAFFKYSNKLDRLNYTNDTGEVFDETLGRSYSFAPFMRNYLPLGKGTFSLFNETNLEFTYSSEVRQVDDPVDINRTVSDTYQLKLGIQPGIAAFITDLVSFEVGTSILGLSSKYTTTTVDGDEDNQGTKFSNDVSFEIDLLSLFLGITFYFPVK